MPDRRPLTVRSPALKLALLPICMAVAYCHMNLSQHVIEPASFFAFGSREPFIYRILLPAIFQLLPASFQSCRTHLPFPLEHCQDAAALVVDWLALVFSCVILLRAFRIIAAHDGPHLRQPALVVPLFLWIVIFEYVLVVNGSMYYPYDFLQLLFFASAVWVGVSPRRAYWLLPLLAFVGALNKEDAIFLPVTAGIFAYWVGRLHRGMLVSIGIAVIAVVAAKYASLLYVRDILGLPPFAPSLFEYHLAYNLHQVINPVSWLSWMCIFGGGVFMLTLPLPRINRLKLLVLVIFLAYLPVVFTVGESREIRLFGPLICAVLLPLMLTINALLFDATDAPAPSAAEASRRSGHPLLLRLGGAIVAVALAVVAFRLFLLHNGVALGAGAAAVPGAYQHLLSCEGTRIHSCKTRDGTLYACLYTNDSQDRMELSDIRLWNYGADDTLLGERNIDAQYEVPPGRTVIFQFHNPAQHATHGLLCTLDPREASVARWFDAM
jgi:hypothetical protein